MLKIVNSKKYQHLVSLYNSQLPQIGDLKTQVSKLKLQLDMANEEREKLSIELEEQKEKYKKYMKSVQKTNSQAAKKWLNGYPDE
jgi:regulator of replication initiation timing